MKNSKLIFWAIVDSLGIFAYVALFSYVIFHGEKFFDKVDNFTGPMMFLLVFIVSATITGGLFLGRPILLYLEGQKKEAIKLFFYTLASLITLTLFVFIIRIL